MRSKISWKKAVLFATAGILAVILSTQSLQAAEDKSAPAAKDEAAEVHSEAKSDSGASAGVIAIAAALAIGLTAFATGYAQARIGSAGIGAISENPKRLGGVIMLVAIPETVAILGFVVAYLILSKS